LTIVFPKNPSLPDVVTAGLGTVAVRLPKNDELCEMLRRTGPLATSSANLSGEAPEGVPSTVVGLTASGFEILREGAAPASEIAAALRPEKTGVAAGEGGLHGS
jgi:L-threonylcarbamoyladenylate synthase